MALVRISRSEFVDRRAGVLSALHDESGIAVEFGDEPDVLQLDEWQTISSIRAGVLVPLGRLAARDGFDLDDFPQALIDRFRASDVVYAIPAETRSNVLLFRRDWLDRYGLEVPRSWDGLAAAARMIQTGKRREGFDDVVGFAGVGLAGYDENFQFLGESLFPSWGWRWSRGADGPPRIYERATVEALSWYVDLLREVGPVRPELTSNGAARQLFEDGKSGFLIDNPSSSNWARIAAAGETNPGIGLATIPVGPTGRPEPGLRAMALCIPRTNGVIEEAWEVIKALNSPDALLDDLAVHGLPNATRQSVLSSPAFAHTFGSELWQTMNDTRGHARINRPMIEAGVDFGDIAGAAAEAAIAGLQSSDEALRIAQAMIDEMS